jgi:hypothetical protein
VRPVGRVGAVEPGGRGSGPRAAAGPRCSAAPAPRSSAVAGPGGPAAGRGGSAAAGPGCEAAAAGLGGGAAAAGLGCGAASRPGAAGALGRSGAADRSGAVDRSSAGAVGPPRSRAGLAGVGSVVTRCHSSTISNGRWTTEQAWSVGTAAGSSLGSRTRTRRPSKRDLTRLTACLRRGTGRSMTTASMSSAGRSDQAWMLGSSVTRPVPWSSARRARPSEGSRRRSTTWRNIR